MKQLQLNKQQQQEFGQKMNTELERVTMSWDNVLKEWYPLALRALDFASAVTLNIPQNKFVDLFKNEVHGINMNIVMVLANNLESRTPNEMGVNAKRWSEILLMNHSVATRWNELVKPIQEKVVKEFEIMANKPKLLIAGEA